MMVIKGGADRHELDPQIGGEDTLGSHRGPYEALNIRYPVPGRVYAYKAINNNRLQAERNRGWFFITSDSPERWGIDLKDLPMEIQTSLDSTRPFGDVILMGITEENYKKLKDSQDERSRAALEGAEASYRAKGEETAALAGDSTGGRELYYKRGSHGYFVQEGKEE